MTNRDSGDETGPETPIGDQMEEGDVDELDELVDEEDWEDEDEEDS